MHNYEDVRLPSMRRLVLSSLITGLLAGGWTVQAPAQVETEHPDLYSGIGQLYPHTLLTNAYAKVWNKYAVDPDSHACEPMEEMQATPLQGQVDTITANRIFLRTSDGQRVALTSYRGSVPTSNAPINCMVIRAGSRTISVRDKNREVGAVPQYRDVTMGFADFVGFLRTGFHFPEAPELMTQPGRKRLSATERISGSKVDAYLRQRPDETTLPETNAPAPGY